MGTNPQQPQVIFFFGAGASVAAGVPDTYSFVTEFLEAPGKRVPGEESYEFVETGNLSLEEEEKEPQGRQDTIKKIVEKLKVWKGAEIDVELLLETLTKLETRQNEPLLEFYNGGKFVLEGHYKTALLIRDLKDFIKSKAIVHEDKIGYLESLRGFVDEYPKLNIISVNYDTCVEQFCNIHKLTYQDGFDVNWNPKNFESEHTDVRLYKLHGSVMWYQSDRGSYLKLPVMEGASQLQLITGEKAENLMLYPMQKWGYAEPLLELLILVKNLLESKRLTFLVVVGYSFRDDHILRILWDAARKNKELRLILIDPKANEIYSKKLKHYGTGPVSSLAGKVICLPYLFEKVLPYLRNKYLTHLTVGHNNEKVQRNTEITGTKAEWIYPIQEYLNAEYTEKVEDLLKKIDLTELEKSNWQFCLELYLKMAVNMVINKQTQEGKNYFEKFNNLLYQLMVEKLNIDFSDDGTDVVLHFNYHRTENGASYFSVEPLKGVIGGHLGFCTARAGFICNSSSELNGVIERIKLLKEYLEPFDGGSIEFEAYLKLRNDKKGLTQRFRDYLEIASPETHTDIELPVKAAKLRTELISVISEIEKNILRELFQKTS